MSRWLFLLFCVLFQMVWCSGQLTAQETTMVQKERQISQETWKKATKGLDYSQDVPKPSKERKPKEFKTPGAAPDFSGIGKGIQVLFVVLGMLIIGFIIYRISQQKFDKTIAADGVEITTDNIENYLDEVDVDAFLHKAIAEQKYNLAIRLYYLKSIKALDTKGKVKWEKQKTNRDYLRETRGLYVAPLFKELTTTYEQTWYGEKNVNQSAFQEIESDFKLLLSKI